MQHLGNHQSRSGSNQSSSALHLPPHTAKVYQWRAVISVIATALALALGLILLARVIGFDSPWIVLLVMFNCMGLAKVAEPIFVLRMPTSLGPVRQWEHAGTLYRRLGVRQFGALLRNTPLRYLNTGVYLPAAGGDLSGLYRHAASAEATHFWAALAFTPYLAYLFLSGRTLFATGFLAVQVLFNLYPILHLRLLRARLDSVLQWQTMRKTAGASATQAIQRERM